VTCISFFGNIGGDPPPPFFSGFRNREISLSADNLSAEGGKGLARFLSFWAGGEGTPLAEDMFEEKKRKKGGRSLSLTAFEPTGGKGEKGSAL